MSALGAGPSSEAATIVMVGSVNVDTILRVTHLPAPGETIIASSETERQGGKGANQAVCAAALLPGVALVACVGDDDRGARALASLANAGVDDSRVSAQRAPTGSSTVIVDDAGENTIVVAPGANSLLTAEEVTDAVTSLAASDTVVVVSLEIPVETVEAAARAAKSVGARFILNPAPGRRLPESLLARCDVLVPDAVEMTQLTGGGSPEAIFAAGAGALIVTRGAAGAEIMRPSGPGRLVPALSVKAVDTTGAGDAFVAALAVGLHDGLELEAAVRMAVAAGAIACTAAGARGAVPTRTRITELLAQTAAESLPPHA
jgi:ribokinase